MNRLKAIKKNIDQQGMASIVIVSMLVVLLGLLSVGFSRIANRDLYGSLRSQQSRSAYYAAESGINNAIKLLNNNLSHPCGAKLDTCQSTCQNSLQQALGPPDNSTSYNCALFNPTPTDLSYQKIDAGHSQEVKLSSDSPLGSLFFYWTRADGAAPKFVPSGTSLIDENTWAANGYAPLLRLTIFPIPSNNSLADLTSPGKAGFAKTFFLFPGSAGGTSVIDYQATPTGSLISVNCGASSFGSYSYKTPTPASSYCAAVISNLPDQGDNGSYFYARLAPLYAAASQGIQAQAVGSTTNASFDGVQAIIDITAKSGDIVRRLEARVSLTGASNGVPPPIPPEISGISEWAMNSASTVCKRFMVPPIGNPIVSVSDPADCNVASGGGGPPPPDSGSKPVAVTGSLTYTQGNLQFNGTVQPNDSAATYYFTYGTYSPILNQWAQKNYLPAAPPGGALNINQGTSHKYPVSVQAPFASFQDGQTYSYQLCAQNKYSGGQASCGTRLSFVFQPPPPPPSSSGPGSSSSGPPGSSSSGPPPIGACNVSSVNRAGSGPTYASYQATGSCPSGGGTWTWAATWGSCDSESGAGSSATVPRYFNNPGSISFTISNGIDSPGTNGNGVDPGNLLCP